MRARTTPYTPDPSSLTYPCGRVSVRLLGGDGPGYMNLVERLREALPLAADASGADAFIRETQATNGALACYTYALWDDPNIGWVANFDPDEVLLAKGDRLVEIADALRAELWAPGARRLGIDLTVLAQKVLPLAAWGLPPAGESQAPTPET